MEYSVRIRLTEEQDVRLRALTEEYNRVMGASVSPERLIENLIALGCFWLVEERMQHLTDALKRVEEAGKGE